MKKLAFLMLLPLCITVAQAQSVKLNGDMCSYRIHFDGNKYSAQQMKNTWEMLYQFNPLASEDSKNSPSEIISAYKKLENQLNAYQLLPQSYFSDFRAKLLKRLAFFRDTSLTEARARQAGNPALLGVGLPESITNKCTAFKSKISHSDLANGTRTFIDWHNCINDQQPQDPQYHRDTFHKIFVKAAATKVEKLTCDEP